MAYFTNSDFSSLARFAGADYALKTFRNALTWGSPKPIGRYTQAQWDALPTRKQYLALKAQVDAGKAATQKIQQYQSYLLALPAQQALADFKATIKQAYAFGGGVERPFYSIIPKVPALASDASLQSGYQQFQQLVAAENAPSGLTSALNVAVPIGIAILTGTALASASGILGGGLSSVSTTTSAGATGATGSAVGATGATSATVINTGVTSAMETASQLSAASAPGVASAQAAIAEVAAAPWSVLSTGSLTAPAVSVADIAQNIPKQTPSAPSAPSVPTPQSPSSVIESMTGTASKVGSTIVSQAVNKAIGAPPQKQAARLSAPVTASGVNIGVIIASLVTVAAVVSFA